MSSDILDELAPFLTVGQTIVFPIATLSAMYFVYGIYVVLFGTCVYMMRNHEEGERNVGFYLTLAIILFGLSTVFIVDATITTIHSTVIRFNTVKDMDPVPFVKYLTHDTNKTVEFAFYYLVPVFLNITAECMLIHRCYVIWGSRKRVAVPLIATSIAVNALGATGGIMGTIGSIDQNQANLFLLGQQIFAVYGIASSVNNSILTLLAAGRIWWIHRQVRRREGMVYTSDRFVEEVTRIIFESGTLYPVIQIVSIVVTNTSSAFDPYPIATLSAGIAPTLILVRAKLGKNVEELQNVVSDIKFTSASALRGPTNTTTSEVPAQTHTIRSFVMAAPHEETGKGNAVPPV